MSAPAVEFEGVWKRFRRAERHTSFRDLIPALGRRILARQPPESGHANDFWAVKDASFEVRSGEALGIIGANGAGKSTTLKLLTRILKPTRGHCAVRGRIGALIEVAAGFHPDLTGRENIYLQGAIMGMKRREIARKLDAIVEFAGVQDFLQTPVKRYSTGMSARLGFSIAAHMEPDVLLIDEVLAVGDLAFQERCHRRMQEFRREGVAIVFVSHNLGAVGALCDRVALFDHGQILTIGAPRETFAVYADRSTPADAAPAAAGGRIEVLGQHGHGLPLGIAAGSPVLVKGVVPVVPTPGWMAFSLRIRRIDTGECVYRTTSRSLGCEPLRLADTPAVVEVQWRFNANLARGHYVLELALIELAHRRELTRLTSAPLNVLENESEYGVTYVASACETRVIELAECAREVRM
jgi:ABC-type polysaccharide/polyol phosphate transport system ATPase subunit